MRVTILHYLEKEENATPDIVVDQLHRALVSKGHQVSTVGAHNDVRKLVSGLLRRKPDIVFNVLEMFGRKLTGDVSVAGLLDLLDIPYTGGGPGELYLQQDKV